MNRTLALLVALAASATGCTINDNGRDPPQDQLFYPADVAIEPTGRFAFVTNANTDLRFNGGTLVTLDLDAARSLVADFRAAQVIPPTCRRDLLDSGILICSEATPGLLLADRTIKVGNFAGAIVYQDHALSGGAPNTGRLFMLVRGDPSVVWVDVERDGADLPVVRCGSAPAGVLTLCAGENRMVRSGQNQEFPPEPFSLSLDPYFGVLWAAHFGGGGAVSVFDVGGGGQNRKPTLVDVAPDMLRRSGDQGAAAFGVAARVDSDPAHGTPYAYFTSRVSNDVAIASLRGAARCMPTGGADPCVTRSSTDLDIVRTALPSLFETDAPQPDLRDIKFSSDGSRAFIVSRQPGAVLIYDTSYLAGDRRPRLFGNGVVEVCSEPTNVAVYERDGRTQLYVTCFGAGQVFVVDPDLRSAVAALDVGRGPNGVRIAHDSTAAAGAPRRTDLGVIANFADTNVSLIDLEPGSPSENRVVLKIGRVRPIAN
jgi:DNA-binding beta-propeller fold protein YncE